MLETQVKSEAGPSLRDRTDLDHPIYIGRIEPDHCSDQERYSANIRSVLVFEVFLGDLEEPVSVHEWEILEVNWVRTVFMPVVADSVPHRESREQRGSGHMIQ